MLSLLDSLSPISQGAEAKVYKCYLHGPNHLPLLLKHRFEKRYRHPSLDQSLTTRRVAGEARVLLKCLKSGVRVPGVRTVDASCGVLGLEWIEGCNVKSLLEAEEDGVSETALASFGVSMEEVMRQIGVEIAKMHLADIIHGDLTTSNMMLRPVLGPPSSQNARLSSELVLIDFGLSFVSSLIEDKAVDLYVLERAFTSTHPNSASWFDAVLKSYGEASGKACEPIYKRLELVRLRGRKRNMVG